MPGFRFLAASLVLAVIGGTLLLGALLDDDRAVAFAAVGVALAAIVLVVIDRFVDRGSRGRHRRT